jgi:CheY-like chemotaxis protein
MRKVLIAEDDEALRRLMRLELCDGYDVIDSGEPEQGLALALEHRPDAILLDLRMSKYSEYELLQMFTSFSGTQMIPVIIVSGEAGGQTKEHCKQLGAAGYFEKPIDFELLRAFLGQVAKTRKYTPRTEVRVRLRVALRLRGTDSQGKDFEAVATTENVSLSGFLCGCAAELAIHSIVNVYIVDPQTTMHREHQVGKAKIVHADSKDMPIRHYGCRFTEKIGPWVLQ